jgi:hypothetical protein
MWQHGNFTTTQLNDFTLAASSKALMGARLGSAFWTTTSLALSSSIHETPAFFTQRQMTTPITTIVSLRVSSKAAMVVRLGAKSTKAYRT